MNNGNLFSKCLRDLLLCNDVVTVPGLGCFIAQNMPASFSDKCSTINPPYRKLFFRAVQKGDPHLFVGHLATMLDDSQEASVWLYAFIKDFKAELDRSKKMPLEGLGYMRATSQNDYFFVADDDLDIYPEGMGLESVTIKSKVEPVLKPEPIAEPEHEPISEPQPEPQPEIEPISEPEREPEREPEPESEPVPEPEPALEPEPILEEPQPESISEPELQLKPEQEPIQEPEIKAKRPRKKLPWWAVLLIVMVSILLVLVVIIAFREQLPWGETIDDLLNKLLYTEEELMLLNL